jgi:dihydrolipoamide dehydrogenase
VEITQVAAIAIAAKMRVDELAHIPLSFPTYAGILARVAASAARELNLESGLAAKSGGEQPRINFEGTTGIREQ